MADDNVHKDLRFGPFELSSRERALRREGMVLPLGSRALDILIYLAQRPGEVIAKQDLIDHVWPDVTVEEGSLRVHVAAIRKALADGQFGNRYVANIRGRGYSFVGTVVPLAARVSRPELPGPSHRTVIPRHRTRALGCLLLSRRPGPPLYDQHWRPVRRWR
jgi:DNA-binding winged helix-turn-helix (wHTH) protein